MPDAPLISVILCTHNPRVDYLARTLAGLKAQSLPRSGWELLVIDNRSDSALAGRVDLSWHPRARVVREETLGLTPARLRGIRESCAELLVFVDDDNVLDADYLKTAWATAEAFAFLGAWSGQCRPVFEEPPPEWTRRYWGNLAIREFDFDVWSNLPRLAATMPCGAGLCVRRGAAQHYLELHEQGDRPFQFDRTGTSLVSGGDNDLAACACRIGLGVGLIAALKLQHLMSRERFTLDYLSRLAEGIQYSSVLLDAEWGLRPKRRGRIGGLADTLRIARLGRPHRQIARAAYRGRRRALALIEASGLNRQG
jgi:glycosyltransferase involved in cell wall biosynthesis